MGNDFLNTLTVSISAGDDVEAIRRAVVEVFSEEGITAESNWGIEWFGAARAPLYAEAKELADKLYTQQKYNGFVELDCDISYKGYAEYDAFHVGSHFHYERLFATAEDAVHETEWAAHRDILKRVHAKLGKELAGVAPDFVTECKRREKDTPQLRRDRAAEEAADGI